MFAWLDVKVPLGSAATSPAFSLSRRFSSVLCYPCSLIFAIYVPQAYESFMTALSAQCKNRNDSRRGDGIRRDLSCLDLKLMRSTLIQLKYYPAFKCGRFHGTRRSQEDRGVVEKALKGVRIYNNDPAQIFATICPDYPSYTNISKIRKHDSTVTPNRAQLRSTSTCRFTTGSHNLGYHALDYLRSSVYTLLQPQLWQSAAKVPTEWRIREQATSVMFPTTEMLSEKRSTNLSIENKNGIDDTLKEFQYCSRLLIFPPQTLLFFPADISQVTRLSFGFTGFNANRYYILSISSLLRVIRLARINGRHTAICLSVAININ
ncbi:hypothetical protein EAG_02099 [Camponotus floridanus]|uniref:Uncharacterized protein n=1 Tax=Camponotus floridanus TaxID=104421 RepID=E2B1N1_CAMFO|nr:hypothetical protein EAG_02099 [Camponotus floridanus]